MVDIILGLGIICAGIGIIVSAFTLNRLSKRSAAQQVQIDAEKHVADALEKRISQLEILVQHNPNINSPNP